MIVRAYIDAPVPLETLSDESRKRRLLLKRTNVEKITFNNRFIDFYAKNIKETFGIGDSCIEIIQGGQDMQKEECETIIEKTRARLCRVPLRPETLIYTSVFYNACTLAGLGQYRFAISICKALEEYSDAMPVIDNSL